MSLASIPGSRRPHVACADGRLFLCTNPSELPSLFASVCSVKYVTQSTGYLNATAHRLAPLGISRVLPFLVGPVSALVPFPPSSRPLPHRVLLPLGSLSCIVLKTDKTSLMVGLFFVPSWCGASQDDKGEWSLLRTPHITKNVTRRYRLGRKAVEHPPPTAYIPWQTRFGYCLIGSLPGTTP